MTNLDVSHVILFELENDQPFDSFFICLSSPIVPSVEDPQRQVEGRVFQGCVVRYGGRETGESGANPEKLTISMMSEEGFKGWLILHRPSEDPPQTPWACALEHEGRSAVHALFPSLNLLTLSCLYPVHFLSLSFFSSFLFIFYFPFLEVLVCMCVCIRAHAHPLDNFVMFPDTSLSEKNDEASSFTSTSPHPTPLTALACDTN